MVETILNTDKVTKPGEFSVPDVDQVGIVEHMLERVSDAGPIVSEVLAGT